MFNLIDNSQLIKKISNELYAEINEKYGITQNELVVILYLNEVDEKNNTAKNIVENLMFSKSHVSSSIDSLASKEFLVRSNDENDKKIIHLKLTRKCNCILEEAEKQKKKLLEIILKDFSDEEIENMRMYSRKIHTNIKNYLGGC